MPTEVMNLPLHPLAVHLPVVLVPALAAVVVTYVVIPRSRRPTGWLLLLLSVVAPAAVFVARASGQQLQQQRLDELGSGEFADDSAASMNYHSQFGDTLLWLVLALAPVAWLFAAVASRRLHAWASARGSTSLSGLSDPARGLGRVATIVLGVIAMVLAAAVVWCVVRAGHTGAEMIWAG